MLHNIKAVREIKMRNIKLVTIAMAFSGLLLMSFPSSLAQNTATYQPIPPGFDFPADETELIGFRNTENVPAMRKHAWLVFAGMTQPARGGEAIWETWFSGQETFHPGATPQALAPRKIQRKFQAPRQFKSPLRGPNPQAVGAALASFTLFNREARAHIRANSLHYQNKLDQLNQGFPPNTPIEKREITQFPREAMSLKTAWWVVKKSGLTAMPIWDPISIQANQPGIGHSAWKRAVAVDPSRTQIPPGEKADIFFNGQSRPGSHVAPLASFYNFKLSAEDADVLRQLSVEIPNLSTAEAGDSLALIALHYTTKEIPDWVWTTFWWHDKPHDGPFAAGRPSEVKGVWRNYLMDVAFSMDTPKESDGNPNACFNPWLEARFQDGVNSNCMTCHQRATWPSQGFLPVTRGALKPNDQFFANKMKLDFLWSVALESQ